LESKLSFQQESQRKVYFLALLVLSKFIASIIKGLRLNFHLFPISRNKAGRPKESLLSGFIRKDIFSLDFYRKESWSLLELFL